MLAYDLGRPVQTHSVRTIRSFADLSDEEIAVLSNEPAEPTRGISRPCVSIRLLGAVGKATPPSMSAQYEARKCDKLLLHLLKTPPQPRPKRERPTEKAAPANKPARPIKGVADYFVGLFCGFFR